MSRDMGSFRYSGSGKDGAREMWNELGWENRELGRFRERCGETETYDFSGRGI